MTANDPVTITIDDGVAVVRIDDGKANAFSHDVIAALEDALATATDEARALVLLGREGRFSGGFDLTTMQAGVSEARDLLRAGAIFGAHLYEAPLPTVIGCTGHAIAMGAILQFCADVRIGADGPFKIGMTEVAIGMPVPRFAIALARQRLTPTELTAAVNLAKVYSPAEAVAAGYLDEIVAPEVVADTAIERGRALAEGLNAKAFAATRELLRRADVDAVRAGLNRDIETFEILAG